MTMLEKLKQEYPEMVGDEFEGGTAVCPEDLGYEEISCCPENRSGESMRDVCRRCWSRTLEGER